jgi:hypothetical protein
MSRRLREKRDRRREQCYQVFPSLRPRLIGSLADLFPPPMAITVTAEEQDVMAHNQARYAELEKLRRGQANTYHETRYRA